MPFSPPLLLFLQLSLCYFHFGLKSCQLMTFKPLFGQITILSLNLVNFLVSRFNVSHLTHETFKLCLQNTLKMSKTARVYFGALQYSFHFNSQSWFSIPICHSLKSIQFGSALNKFNLCFRYTRYRNHRHGPTGLQAGIKNGFITQYGLVGLLTGYKKN